MSDSRVPVVISTWPFGMPANEAAWKLLSGGGDALDSVIAGVSVVEDDPNVESVGYGGMPDSGGDVTLDASVMDDRGHCGSVAAMTRIKNAARAARLAL